MGCRVAVLAPIIPCLGDVFADDLAFGLMRRGHKRGVATYPDPRDESWQIILRAVKNDVPGLIPPSMRLEFAPFKDEQGNRYSALIDHEHFTKVLTALTCANRVTGRIHLDPNSHHGVEMIESFPELIDAAYMIGWRIDGFYEFIS
jgi:hypothetical protein